MRVPFAQCLCALLLAAFACAAQAATVTRIEVRGLNEAMAQNVQDALSLQQAVGKTVSGRRLGVLLRAAEDEARGALEPFGYYAPTIGITRTGAADAPVVVVTVDPGTPVRVRAFSVVMEGEGGSDAALRKEIDAFAPRPGAVFEHALYETSKGRVNRRLAERGYFDAELGRHRVEVTRAARAADIDLAWQSGVRYALGDVTFTQTPGRWCVRSCSRSWCAGRRANPTTRRGSTGFARRCRRSTISARSTWCRSQSAPSTTACPSKCG